MHALPLTTLAPIRLAPVGEGVHAASPKRAGVIHPQTISEPPEAA
jgi:hypothetical protein